MTTSATPPNLLLRPPLAADAAALSAAVQLPQADVAAWIDGCGPDYDSASAAGWIESTLAARERGEAFEFLIVAASSEVLGCCGLNAVAAGIAAYREGLQERRLRTHGVFHDAVMFAMLRPAAEA